ncbi:ABC transporter substrate-binding protein [Pasteurellaceae bacterium RH1A]|nr:ABC transporter substrate-binding protein [Pasteurellaceae bacterium RH1A]
MKRFIPLFLSLFSATVLAHPHAFLDIKNRIIIEDEQLKGFEMAWTLDDLASSELLYELKSNPNKQEAEEAIVADLSQTAIGNHYFSYLYDEHNQPIKFKAQPHKPRIEIKQNRVIYHFRFDLSQPQAVKGKSFQLYTYEPSYYLYMGYERPQDVSLNDDKLCTASLTEPQVSSQIKNYALSLDKSQTPDMPADDAQSLGAMFAQKVSLVCKK